MGDRLAHRFDLEDEAWRLAGYFQQYAPPSVLGGGAFFCFLTQTNLSRSIAGCARFFIFTQSFERSARCGCSWRKRTLASVRGNGCSKSIWS